MRTTADSLLDRGMFGLEGLEPRIVLSTTPSNPDHTVVEMVTNQGSVYIELFDTTTPNTVTNWLNYILSDRYDGSFIHRSVSNFVIQGGGFYYSEVEGTPEVPTDDPVGSEPGISNTERTIAMALSGTDANSGDSQFFFNLRDNSSTLDEGNLVGNPPFSVFGEVIMGWEVVEAIAALETADFGGGSGPFTTVPVTELYDPNGTDVVGQDELVMVWDVQVEHVGASAALRAQDGASLSAASGADGSLAVGVRNTQNAATSYTLAGGQWTGSVPTSTTDGPLISGDVVTWVDPKDGLKYAAAPSGSGVQLYRQASDGSWTVRNLSSELSVGFTVAQLTAFTDPNGLVYIAGMNNGGDLFAFIQDGGTDSSGQFTYRSLNITDTYLTPNGMDTPDFQGALTSYVPSWGALNIVGIDGDGVVHSVWTAPDLGGTWRTDNLSAITGAPALVGPLNVYLTSWNGINLAGTDADGNVQITWWVPEFGGDWVVSDLTSQFAGPALTPGSLTSYVTPWGALNVAGTDSSGNVVVYWWTPDLGPTNPWIISNLNDVVPSATTPTGTLEGVASPTGTINLFGLEDGTSKIFRYSWDLNTLLWSSEIVDDISI